MRLAALIVIMPVDTFTGVVLGFARSGVTSAASRAWGPTPVQDVHSAGALMWIGGDAIMLALIMVVFVIWSHDDHTASDLGWLESVRRARLARLGVGGAEPTPGDGEDVDDDDQQLAAY